MEKTQFDRFLAVFVWSMIVLYAAFLMPFSSSALASDGKPRIFITDSKSWQSSGGFAATSSGAVGGVSGGARPQTAEIIKTFNERCASCIVTMKQEKADFIVILEHEGGKGWGLKDNKFAVFNKDGDAIKSGSTRSLGNAVKDACKAIMDDWSANGSQTKERSTETQPTEKE